MHLGLKLMMDLILDSIDQDLKKEKEFGAK